MGWVFESQGLMSSMVLSALVQVRRLGPGEAGLLPAAKKANMREQGLSSQQLTCGLPGHHTFSTVGKEQLWGNLILLTVETFFRIYNVDNLGKLTVGKLDKF